MPYLLRHLDNISGDTVDTLKEASLCQTARAAEMKDDVTTDEDTLS